MSEHFLIFHVFTVSFLKQVLGIMKAQGQPPNALTYGCLLLACQHRGDIDGALNLYRQARICPPHDALCKASL